MAKTAADFFREPHPHSGVKADIVAKYLPAWMTILGPYCDELTYLDLYSGRGIYEDGTPSTPIKVLDAIAEKPQLLGKLRMHFYESDREMCRHLDTFVKSHKVCAQLNHEPEVHQSNVDHSLIAKLPINQGTFTFIDPCGYHGLTVALLVSVIKRWGSDCLFLLSTHGIKRNIGDEGERPHMEELFGKSGRQTLERDLKHARKNTTKDRLILDALESNLTRNRSVYMIRFAMEFEDRKLTSHHLVFVCKHHRGFALMKDVTAKFSLVDAFGVPLWLYSSLRSDTSAQSGLGLDDQIQKLMGKLARDFRGETLSAATLVDRCHRKKYMYTEKNIKAAVDILEVDGKLTIDLPREKRIRGGQITLGKDRLITFGG